MIAERNQSWLCELKSFGYLKLGDEQLNTELKYAYQLYLYLNPHAYLFARERFALRQ